MSDQLIEDGLRAVLLTFDAVTSTVGLNPKSNDRVIRPHFVDEEDPLPWLVIEVDDENIEDNDDLDGGGGLVRSTVLISAIADNPRQARQLANAVRTNNADPADGLAGYVGMAGTGYIDKARLIRRRTSRLFEDDGSDSGLFVCESEYEVWYRESIPEF